MGKQNGVKVRKSGQLSGQLQAFFHPSPATTSSSQAEGQTVNMAPAGGGNGVQASQITKDDLIEIKNDLKQHLASLIDTKLDPLMEQISTFSSTIKEVANSANAAYGESGKNGGFVNELKMTECQLRDHIAWLEQRAHAMNLKLCGIPEFPEINNALLRTISTWLTPLLHLEWNATPTITSAYRVGAASLIRPNFSNFCTQMIGMQFSNWLAGPALCPILAPKTCSSWTYLKTF